jgi:hypothetical protein
MNNKCIVNFSNGKWYRHGQKRVVDTISHFTKCDFFDFLLFKEFSEINSPTHYEIPYAFKFYCLKKAIEMGYETILWLDSSMYAIKDIKPVFDYLEENYYAVTWSEFNNAQWTNDKMLDFFHYTRDEAEKTRHLFSGFFGINIKFPKFNEFYSMYENTLPYLRGNHSNHMKTESSDRRCLGHRHDQSALSLIFNRLGMTSEEGEYFEYYNDQNIYKEKTCFVAKGM